MYYQTTITITTAVPGIIVPRTIAHRRMQARTEALTRRRPPRARRLAVVCHHRTPPKHHQIKIDPHQHVPVIRRRN
ncbi:unnamed protein product [Anisakis simplex]|uniref:Uncharacterized protein n=1 Tax=Anisakis simplex TaxID=6269 RepID=A0A3P6PBP1_ANISI|nr:unnamed protein product [Anisakis simplex]